MRVACVLILSCLVLLGATECGSVPPASSSRQYEIATTPPGQATLLARADGVLAGKVNRDGTACFWLSNGDAQLLLYWPDGYYAGGASLTVFDRAGTKRASVGQRVTFAGGLAPDGYATPLGCAPSTHVWIVGEVVAAT